MTKVPFDWNVFLDSKVIVKLTSRQQAKNFLSHFELTYTDSFYTEERLFELVKDYDGFRFDKCCFEGHGTYNLYPAGSSIWSEYLMMEYDNSDPNARLPEVGDLL